MEASPTITKQGKHVEGIRDEKTIQTLSMVEHKASYSNTI